MVKRIRLLGVLFILSLPFSSTSQDHEAIDSLQALISSNPHDTVRITALKQLGFQFRNTDPDTGIYYCKLALAISKEIKWDIGITASSHLLGMFGIVQGDYQTALVYFEKALAINERLDKQGGIAQNLGNIAIVHRNLGNYPASLEAYFKALKIHESLFDVREKSKGEYSRNLGNIGLVYWNQGDLEKALEYYFKAMKMDKELGRKGGISSNMGNIALVYQEQGKLIEALEYQLQALQIDKELGNAYSVTRHLGNIGLVYDALGDIEKSLEYYEKALVRCIEFGDKKSACINLSNIGSHHVRNGNYKKGESTLLEARTLAIESNVLNHLRGIELKLSQLYEETGQYKKSYEHYINYSEAKDSLFNEEKSKELGKLEAKHEFETAEEERARALEEQSKKEKVERERRDNLQYSGILIFLVLVFAGVFALGRISLPIRLAEGLIFFSFLLFFEFTLVLLDPYIESFSSGAPAIKLGFNALLAATIFPLHSLFETKLKKRLVK